MGYQIVAIEREYATGGQDIGARVGEMLEIPCYGRDILQMAAREWNTEAAYIEHLEENFTNSLLYSIGMAARAAAGQGDGLSEEGRLFLTENQIVKRLALEGPCVFVGRCAGWALRRRTDVLNVFIYGDWDCRIRRAIEEYGIPEREAESALKRRVLRGQHRQEMAGPAALSYDAGQLQIGSGNVCQDDWAVSVN